MVFVNAVFVKSSLTNGVFEHAAANTVAVPRSGFEEYGTPDAIVTDNGTQFETMEEFVKWQNYIKPHRGLRYKRPSEVFFNRLQPERVF